MSRSVLLAFLFASPDSRAIAQDDEERFAARNPGLIATYSEEGPPVVRIDDAIAFDWRDRGSDRPSNSSLTVRWVGDWRVQATGRYVISVFFSGRVKLQLDGNVVLQSERKSAGWIESKPLTLQHDLHPVSMEYDSPSGGARLYLCWQSDEFPREIAPHTCFAHDASRFESLVMRAKQLAEGDQWIRGLRCAACHETATRDPLLKAPSLTRLEGNIKRNWLVAFLQSPRSLDAGSRMPDFGLKADEAQSVAAALLSSGAPHRERKRKAGDWARGERLFKTSGCLACHPFHDVGERSVFGGSDLSRVGDKRPPEFFSAWLTRPADLNAWHRMPTFPLTPSEVADLAAYLAMQTTPQPAVDDEPHANDDANRIAQGRKLIEAKGCASCHEITGFRAPQKIAAPMFAKQLGGRPIAAGGDGCLGDPMPARSRPGFHISNATRTDIAAAWISLAGLATRSSAQERGMRAIEESNCLSCHARGARQGLRTVLSRLSEEFRKVHAESAPPSLDSVGDKLHDAWLTDAVAGKAPRLRPWLSPRMPAFPFKTDDRDAIVHALVRHDRLPDTPTRSFSVAKSDQLLAAHRLVGPNGFGCMSCHAIGTHDPIDVEPGARGADLRFVGKRMRADWFLRMVRNPARILGGTEMPAITLAVPGVLANSIDAQIDALWHGLNAPQFDLPTAGAVQLLSAARATRSLVIRDVFEHAAQDHTTRPFAIGLVNGHSLLLDLDRFAIRRWWMGDFARQKTRGKTWFWETAGVTIVDAPRPIPMIALVHKVGIQMPLPEGQSAARLIAYEHVADRVLLALAVHFGDGKWSRVTLEIAPTERGLVVNAIMKDVPANRTPLVLLADATAATMKSEKQIEILTPIGRARVGVGGQLETIQSSNRTIFATAFQHDGREWRTRMECEISTDPRPLMAQSSPADTVSTKKLLPVIPGYEAMRLPLPDGPMPTAIAWRSDGSMIVCSLKGEVYLVDDTNGDGFLDRYTLMSDRLAAPYGALCEGTNVLVSHKHELVRLIDRDGDNQVDRTEVIASGWGVTQDYHDWAVGLLRDKNGRYYIAPACQQDDRSVEAATGRGKVLQIDSIGKVTHYAAGIRFAMGLAMNKAGDLFATDNQGNANPFNELNHIRPGRHYGFFGKLERPNPTDQSTHPAIQIPHPWSRSVNGISFVPEGNRFGPFSGHLIGADYTNRSLIRMSLQRVGDTYQGCAYPFSRVDQKLLERDETFLGPVSVGFGPDGSLFVGSMIDSGWGGGNNRGAIERVRWLGTVPFGIREVRAHSGAFDIDFTQGSEPARAGDPSCYTLSCYHRIPTGSYETPDQDRTNVRVERVEASVNGRSVRLFVSPMRAGFVYDIAISRLRAVNEPLWPAVAFYTLNVIPPPDAHSQWNKE